jgi:Zn finger protein HypA/HybF involved in hydrogenase expression
MDNYYDVQQIFYYLCNDCEWTSDGASSMKHLKQYDECPECESTNIQLDRE